MKVAAATILSLVATAAYASPTAYSETQEVGTHDSTTESSADSYLEKRGGGFYGNYAQGAGGVHHAPPNHWNHGSHKTGGHHQYPQTPNPSRLYGSNQPRHRTPPRDLGPYEKLRHDQQQQQQQQQQQHHHHQQQYQQQYHHQHHHHQQHQHHHQHHQQQHHQQKSALQQYQEQRRRQHQQHQQQQQQRLQQYQLQLQYRQQQRHQRQENNSPYNQYGVRHQYNHQPQYWGSRGTSSSHEMNQNAQPVEGGNNEAEVDVETGVTESGDSTETGNNGEVELGGGAYDGEPDTGNNQPKDKDESNGPEVQPKNDNNFESGSFGSDVVTSSGESEDQVTEPETNTKTGDDDEVELGGETNKPGAKKFSFGKMLKSSFQQVFKKKPHTTHSQEHDQDMAKTPEQSTDEDTGPEDSTRTEENGEVGGSGTKPEDNNNFGSELSGSDAETTGDESGDEVTGPETNTETEETVEVEESGANGGEPEPINDQPQGGNDGSEDEENDEFKPENDNNPESRSSGSDVVTASGESEDQVTEYGTKTGDDDEVKPEVEGETNEPEAKKSSLGDALWGYFKPVLKKKFPLLHTREHDQYMTKTPEQSTNEDTGSGDGAKTGETVEVEDEDEEFSISQPTVDAIKHGLEKTLYEPYTKKHYQDMITADGQSEDQVTEPETNTKTEETVEFKPESGVYDSDFDTENNNPEGGNGGPEVQLEDDNNFGYGSSGSDAVTADDESGDEGTGPGDGTEVEESGAKGSESDTKDDDSKGEGDGPKVKSEDNNNFGSGSFGSNAETADDESGDEGTGPGDGTEVEESGTNGGEPEPINDQPQGGNDGSEDEENGQFKPENDNNPEYGPFGSNAGTAGDESGDQATGPEDDTETGDDEEVKLESGAKGGEPEPINDQPQGGNDGSEDEENDEFKPENNNNFGSGPSGSNAETTGEESEDKSTGPADGTETGDDDEFKPEVEDETNEPEAKKPSFGKMLKSSFQRIFGFKSPSPHPQEHDQDMAKTPEQSTDEDTGPGDSTRTEETVEFKPESGAKPEDEGSFEYGPFGSDAETTGGKSEDEVTEPETNTETEETVEVEGSGTNGGEPEPINDQPQGGNDGSEDEKNDEFKPENNNNFGSGPSGSNAETAGDESEDQVTGPEDDTRTEETVEFKPEGGAEGGESNTGNNNPEDESNGPEVKSEDNNNPGSGTSGSDAETADDESEDKVTGSGDDAGTKETGEVEESGAKGGESKPEDAKLEDGAAKPKADRDSAFKSPLDSFMQERRKRVHIPRVRNYDFYTTKKSE
ncbi:hypothetical protein BASA60_008748 [Batrachochytrium salamandrivorans]|nr:hypothetical protein BASA62_007515 [Batrachochytrium salamandrivorans]KAH6568198.1 hypothetical protein BASA60_008748 [Batrachochytrium salamandrivorans]